MYNVQPSSLQPAQLSKKVCGYQRGASSGARRCDIEFLKNYDSGYELLIGTEILCIHKQPEKDTYYELSTLCVASGQEIFGVVNTTAESMEMQSWDITEPNTQVSIAPFLQEILAYLHNLERYVHQRILETRRRVEERLANCPPNFTMRSNEHYISVAPFDNFLGPSLDPTFSALQSEGTGPTPNGLNLFVSDATMIADDEPVAQPIRGLNFNDADHGLIAEPVERHLNIESWLDHITNNAPMIAGDGPIAQPIQGLNLNNAPTIANDGPVVQPIQDFLGASFQKAPRNPPAKARVKCSGCGAIFNKDNWKRHLNEVHGAKPKSSCDRCGKSFKRKSSMKDHKCKSS
ncbi:hypothetical protein BDR04DRAFT_1118315 [Suillus decipiens]|nr:hypothetical protein BDR04DRAFT_1118315 [Suillus decipiens]